jgi:SRSO17 transposase
VAGDTGIRKHQRQRIENTLKTEGKARLLTSVLKTGNWEYVHPHNNHNNNAKNGCEMMMMMIHSMQKRRH